MYRPDDYVNMKAFSQSDFKLFEDSLKNFHSYVILGESRPEKRSDHFDVGDLTEVFLLQESLKSNYGVIKSSIDPGYEAIVQGMFENILFEWNLDKNNPARQTISTNIAAYADKIIPTAKTQCFRYNPTSDKWSWKPETVKEKVLTEAKAYFEEYVSVKTSGKIEIAADSWIEAEQLVKKVKTSSSPEIIALMEQLFVPNPNIIVHIGKPYYGMFKGKYVKILTDFFIEYPARKAIFPFDLKTADSLFGFMRNYWGNGYIRQGALYHNVLAQNFPGYTVNPFNFLVIPKNNDPVELFEMAIPEMNAGLNGGTFKSGKKYRGCSQIMEDIDWHIIHDQWEHRRSYYTNNKNVLNSFADVNAEAFASDLF